MHGDTEIEGSETVALMVREELARRRQSRQWLADEAKVSLSTLEKALAGRRPFTLATVVRLEGALGTSLRGTRRTALESSASPFAPESMGAMRDPPCSGSKVRISRFAHRSASRAPSMPI